MNSLVSLYKKDLIQYPRVENSYIKQGIYSYFPHPTLSVVNEYFTPLREHSYPFNEDSLLLHLHNLRYMNLSQVESSKKLIKKNLNVSSNESKKQEEIVHIYKEFINNKNENDLDYFLKSQREHYSKDKPEMSYINYNIQDFIEDLQKKHEILLYSKDFIVNQEKNTIIEK